MELRFAVFRPCESALISVNQRLIPVTRRILRGDELIGDGNADLVCAIDIGQLRHSRCYIYFASATDGPVRPADEM